MHALLSAERVLEYVIRDSESVVDIAPSQPVLESYIGVFSSYEMLEIGKCRCRLQLGMYRHRRGNRFDLVVNGR